MQQCALVGTFDGLQLEDSPPDEEVLRCRVVDVNPCNRHTRCDRFRSPNRSVCLILHVHRAQPPFPRRLQYHPLRFVQARAVSRRLACAMEGCQKGVPEEPQHIRANQVSSCFGEARETLRTQAVFDLANGARLVCGAACGATGVTCFGHAMGIIWDLK